MRYFFRCTIVLALAILVTGCARFPTTTDPTDIPPRTLYCELTVNPGGQIDMNKYYFLAIGVDQSDATGPVPVVTGPGYTNGWGTITGLPNGEVQQPPFYVQIHNGAFTQYLGTVFQGTPFRYGISDDNQTMWVEIDQRELDPLIGATPNPIIQLNWITMQSVTIQPDPFYLKQYDGFGRSGNSYLRSVPVTVAGIFTSGTLPGSPNYEPIYGPDETTTSDPAIDIAQWRVEVRIRTQ